VVNDAARQASIETLKERLLWNGYLPENVPPAFRTSDVADHLIETWDDDWWSQSDSCVRPAVFNASKRGITRRTFSFVHPVTMRDATQFVVSRWPAIQEFFSKSDLSLSVPHISSTGERALEITTYGQLEAERISRLSHYRFIAKTDISRFYHSIYTHSLSWAFHGKKQAKGDRNPKSEKTFFNRADFILRCGQDGQTIGIPVGPDTSRVFAEVIATAIDVEFRERHESSAISVLRYVDDVWIGANSHAEAERALWRYREAIREFELDINENKTKFYSADFRFADQWPSDLSAALERAIDSHPSRRADRLRSALEQAFALAVSTGDDGILKYVIRYIDRQGRGWVEWNTVEPFLKRCVVHFGHTIDYVARVLVWRHLTKGDLDKRAWEAILVEIIDRHGHIGNDSEVCWAIYACTILGCAIPATAAEPVARNCGALAILSALNGVERNAKKAVFTAAKERLQFDSAGGSLWPVILEWKSRRWRGHKNIPAGHPVISALVENEAVIYQPSRLPDVFRDKLETDFGAVEQAIEDRPSMYDDDARNEDDEPEEDF
jgi:hypothetical protein